MKKKPTCPACEGPTHRHCPDAPDYCPWRYCPTCLIDVDRKGRTKPHG